MEPGGVGRVARRGTAASGAGPPAQRNVRRRDSPVSPRPRPWPWAAAGPGRVRSWCRHDTIAGQEGQVGRHGRPAESPGAEAGIEGPPTAPPPAFGSSRRALTETATVSEGRVRGEADGGERTRSTLWPLRKLPGRRRFRALLAFPGEASPA